MSVRPTNSLSWLHPSRDLSGHSAMARCYTLFARYWFWGASNALFHPLCPPLCQLSLEGCSSNCLLSNLHIICEAKHGYGRRQKGHDQTDTESRPASLRAEQHLCQTGTQMQADIGSPVDSSAYAYVPVVLRTLENQPLATLHGWSCWDSRRSKSELLVVSRIHHVILGEGRIWQLHPH